MELKFFRISRSKFLHYFTICFIVILIFVLSFFLFKSFLSIRRQWMINQYRTMSDFFSSHKLSIKDIDYIENWMTFRYINNIFKIPEGYFKDKLNIKDTKYPNIPLWWYAKHNNIDPTLFLKQVKDALKSFMKE